MRTNTVGSRVETTANPHRTGEGHGEDVGHDVHSSSNSRSNSSSSSSSSSVAVADAEVMARLDGLDLALRRDVHRQPHIGTSDAISARVETRRVVARPAFNDKLRFLELASKTSVEYAAQKYSRVKIDSRELKGLMSLSKADLAKLYELNHRIATGRRPGEIQPGGTGVVAWNINVGVWC